MKSFVPLVRRRALLTGMLPMLAGCGGAPTASLTPQQLPDGWPTADPRTAGFTHDALQALVKELRAGAFPKTHAVLIEHDGNLVFEQYFDGADERWGDPIGHRQMNTDSLHDLRSVSKTVTALLLGIALQKDFEQHVAKPAISFLPTVAKPSLDKAIHEVTLHHVLTMTAGLEWNEMTVPYTTPENDELRMYATSDPVALVLSRPIRTKPGTTWYYNGGLTQVLAAIIQQVTGKPLDAYARESLFQPLGITNFEWLGTPTWKPPMPAAASGLRLHGRDLAKIASLFLHGGRWKAKQIVPQAWIELSSTRHVPSIGDWSRDGTYGYGYQLWHGQFPQGYTSITGVGNGNQRIFALPKEKLAVTVFAGDYNNFQGHSERLLHRIMSIRKPA